MPAKWTHEQHRANCDALRAATAGETETSRERNDPRQEIYDEARFLHMLLVQFAGSTGTRKWNKAIADARKQLAEERARTAILIAAARAERDIIEGDSK